MKICRKCGQSKEDDCFYLRKDTGTFRSWCRVCDNERKRKYFFNEPEKVRAYNNEYKKRWYLAHLTKSREYHRNWKRRKKMDSMQSAFKNAEIIETGSAPPDFRYCLINRERMRTVREAKGMSQGKLGFLAGIPSVSVSSIERGHSERIKIKKAQNIAYALDLKPEELIIQTFDKKTFTPRGNGPRYVSKEENRQTPIDRIKLSQLMVDRGFTVRYLAGKTGIIETQLYKIKSGKTQKPTRKTVEKIATALGVNPETFILQQPVKKRQMKNGMPPIYRDYVNRLKLMFPSKSLNQISTESGLVYGTIHMFIHGNPKKMTGRTFEKLRRYVDKNDYQKASTLARRASLEQQQASNLGFKRAPATSSLWFQTVIAASFVLMALALLIWAVRY